METLTAKVQKEQELLKMFYFGTLVVWFFFPLPSIFLITALWTLDPSKSSAKNGMFILWLSITYGLVAYTGQSIGYADETDIYRYQSAYMVTSKVKSLTEFFVLLALDGAGNFLFYITNFGISRVFPANTQVHIMFWVSITSFFTLFGAFNAFKLLDTQLPDKVVKGMILIFMIGIMPFFTITEIIKQCASVSIFFYAVVLKLSGKRSRLFLIISLLTHISSFILLPIYLFFNKQYIKRHLIFVFIACTMISFLNANTILASVLAYLPGGDLQSRAETYENYEKWSISFRHISTFIVFSLIGFFLFYDYLKLKPLKTPPQLKDKRWLWFNVIFLTFLILLANRSNVHNFVRYIYGLFPFYIFSIIALLNTNILKVEKYTLVTLVILFFSYSNYKLLLIQTVGDLKYANSYYDNSLSNLLGSSVPQYLNFRVK